MQREVTIPDIGDFHDIPVIEVLVSPGQHVAAEAALVTLESDKATLDVPAPFAGTVIAVKLSVGDRVSRGALVVVMEDEAASPAHVPPPPQQPVAPEPIPAADLHADLLVVGAGPGGYTAAFRAADLGRKVVMVNRHEVLGGVCLNVGCIPSKSLLHAAKVLQEARDFSDHGICFAEPSIDLDRLRSWKDGVVGRLTGGLSRLAQQRQVTTVTGTARFASPHSVTVTAGESTRTISFEQVIIAVGSSPVDLPFVPADDPRVIDSTGALALAGIPERLLVLGGGIIGLEMATVYHALGAKVTVVELMDQIIPGVDRDLVAPLLKRIRAAYQAVLLKTAVTRIDAREDGLVATLEGPDGTSQATFDQVLVAVGRKPNGRLLDAQAAGVHVDERGFIPVDSQMRTNVPHVFAIGDVVGQPMLAHKATHEGKVAAEVACGHPAHFDASVIPSVAYTDPEVAWVGMTETAAAAGGIKLQSGVFPWAASGRSLALGRDEGLTKLLFDPATGRVVGGGLVGPSAGDLVAEIALAIEMGADGKDIGLTIHPHPTLSETVGLAAEMFEGVITDLMPRRR